MNVLMPLAEGFEESEAVVVIDLLRRAGIAVTIAATGETRSVTASRNVVLVAETLWQEVDLDACDALVLPGGGPGTARLKADTRVLNAVRAFHTQGKTIGAICAAPAVLAAAGILAGHAFTCYPGCEKGLAGTRYTSQAPVVADGNVITSQGPGTSFEFALALVERLAGAATAAQVAAGLCLRQQS
ncbi:MAG: DJ-1/PfpI family protein [Lentisphaerae bacterium]|nr:DJ-1/PfpI family protein [Lentisphaerota bacterium]